MIIAGFNPLTLLDYPDKLAAIIFTQGCNFACGYCHNKEMIAKCRPENSRAELQPGYILDFLKDRRDLLEAVVVSGGEPTVHDDLKEFIGSLKNLGFAVKLDTNGSNPEKIKELIDANLLDYIAMDVKFTPFYYQKYFPSVPVDKILESIKILMNSKVEYEFRSTILPFYHGSEELEEMGELIKGCKKWYLQSFRPIKTLDRRLMEHRPFSRYELEEFKKLAENYADYVELRT